MEVYKIKDWDKHYENDRSRTRDQLRWCPIPNKRGLGRGRLLIHPNGPAIYGCFVSIVLMCSEQELPRDGWLTEDGKRNGTPLDSAAIHLKTGMPVELIDETLRVVSHSSVGWIELKHTADTPPTPAQHTADTPPTHPEGKGREGNRKERNTTVGEDVSEDLNKLVVGTKLTMLLLSFIKKRNPGHKDPNLIKWTEDFNKMIQLDKRDPKQIEDVIRWCQQDNFWQNNILSPAKLREKYDQLFLKMNSKPPAVKPKANLQTPKLEDYRKGLK